MLSNANKARDWRIYADFAQSLIRKAGDLYHDEDFGIYVENTVYALDSFTIKCISPSRSVSSGTRVPRR